MITDLYSERWLDRGELGHGIGLLLGGVIERRRDKDTFWDVTSVWLDYIFRYPANPAYDSY